MAAMQQTQKTQKEAEDVRTNSDCDVISCLAEAISVLREENLRLHHESSTQQTETAGLKARVAALMALLGEAAPENEEAPEDEERQTESDSEDDSSAGASKPEEADATAPKASKARRVRREDVDAATRKEHKLPPSLLRQALALHLQANRRTATKPKPRARIQQPAMRNYQPGRRN